MSAFAAQSADLTSCPLLAQSGHPSLHRTCPLSRVKRTSQLAARMSANDPKRNACLTDLKCDTTP
jgi:hypothetical protein